MSHPFKSLLPSLLLIAIYFVADEFFGPIAGSLVALLSGIIEFIYTRYREKICNWNILWLTLFFCVPGIISMISTNSMTARLQPAIMETGLCVLTGLFAFSRIDLTTILPVGSRKHIQVSEPQLNSMRHLIKLLFYLLSLHTLLSYSALLFASDKANDFISKDLLYILLALFFTSLFIRNRLSLKKMKKEEWLPIVNEQGEVTGRAPRSLCHSGSKLLHPVVHLHIINERHELFLQKRSMKKDLLPGKWDTAVGGHISWNEKTEDALKRETREELGITDFQAQFIGSYLWESPREKELVFSFICSRHNEIRIDNDEVDEGCFWSKKDIEQGIREENVTPNFAYEYHLLLSKIMD